jgi:hypothetical protein
MSDRTPMPEIEQENNKKQKTKMHTGKKKCELLRKEDLEQRLL